jgi:uncharacterized protein YecT (DUF1311 family)
LIRRLIVILITAMLPCTAHAITCARASSPLERMICSDPKLGRADAEMSRAYGAILKAAPDVEIRAMLVRSQKRWVAARESSFGHLDGATDGMTGNGYSKARQHSLVLQATVERTQDITAKGRDAAKRPRLIQAALQQRRLAAQFSGGPYAGFAADCTFLPDRGEDPEYHYACFGTQQYQNGARICAETQDWASWRVYMSRAVAEVVAGQPKVIAACKETDGCLTDGATAWKTNPPASEARILSPPLPKLDAELDGTDAAWLTACLAGARPARPHKG